MNRIPVIVLGAAGAVGQRFVQLLDGHPWFEVVGLTGSGRAAGKPYGEACHWVLSEPMPEYARDIPLTPSQPGIEAGVAFSALPSQIAAEVEPLFAVAGYAVCSNASAFRLEPDVPLLIPEVNPDHVCLIEVQRARRGWPGWIATNPNCTTVGLALPLKPLHAAFGVRRVMAVSLQALSGAGYPGVPALDIVDNVIPQIEGEEAKVETEPRKLLGRLNGGEVEMADFRISAHTNRVAVRDGHLVCVSVELERPTSPEEAAAALAEFRAPDAVFNLPSAPARPIVVRSEPDRPQPRLDRNEGGGMSAVVGRVRPCPLLGVKFVALTHNTIRGAAGASILNAELLVRQGYVPAVGKPEE